MYAIISTVTKEVMAIKEAVRELELEALKSKQRDAIVSFLSGNDRWLFYPLAMENPLCMQLFHQYLIHFKVATTV